MTILEPRLIQRNRNRSDLLSSSPRMSLLLFGVVFGFGFGFVFVFVLVLVLVLVFVLVLVLVPVLMEYLFVQVRWRVPAESVAEVGELGASRLIWWRPVSAA